MKNVKIENITVCDEKYFKDMNAYITQNDNKKRAKRIIIILVLLLGMFTLKKYNIRVALFLYVLGLVILPLLFYILPYNMRKKMFNKALTKANDKESSIKSIFNEKGIKTSDYAGNAIEFRYKDIDKIDEFNGLIVIHTVNNKYFYYRKDGFKSDYDCAEALKLLKK